MELFICPQQRCLKLQLEFATEASADEKER